jgi:hypothetical protein
MSNAMNRAEQLEWQYCEMLDMEGPVTIGGVSFDPSRILREMDPIAYDQGLAGYMDLAGFDPDEEEEEFNSVGSRHHY